MGHHLVTVTIPEDMTVEGFEQLLTDNGLTYEERPHKKERMEADILKYKGQTIKIGYGNDKIVASYTHNPGVIKKKKKTDKQ